MGTAKSFQRIFKNSIKQWHTNRCSFALRHGPLSQVNLKVWRQQKCSLYDHIRNEDIHKILEIPIINESIELYRNNWYEKILGIPNNKLPQRLYNRPIRRRDSGWPKKCWRKILHSNVILSRPRWSRGNVLASRSSRGRSIFSGRKNPEHKSSGRDF